jgi:hypothetical protein
MTALPFSAGVQCRSCSRSHSASVIALSPCLQFLKCPFRLEGLMARLVLALNPPPPPPPSLHFPNSLVD